MFFANIKLVALNMPQCIFVEAFAYNVTHIKYVFWCRRTDTVSDSSDTFGLDQLGEVIEKLKEVFSSVCSTVILIE